MNRKKALKLQFAETLGYFVEVIYFIASGVALGTGHLFFAFIYFTIGSAMAFVVGKLIILNFKIKENIIRMEIKQESEVKNKIKRKGGRNGRK